MLNPFQTLVPKKFLGIDIGTSFVKMVELSRFGHRIKLENYGSLSARMFYKKPFRSFEKSTLLLSSDDIARAILAIVEEAQIKTRKAVFSIPDFSTFFTNFELPQMSKEEVPQAVRYEARQHIPLPLGEVTLDWQVIEEKPATEKKTIKILLVAVPNEVVYQYQKIAQLSKLDLFALEAEVFSLVRPLIKEDEKEPVGVIDIGAQTTTCSIVDKKIIKMSHSFDMSGDDLTMTISRALNIDFSQANNLKKEYDIKGLDSTSGDEARTIREILLPLIDVFLREIEKTFNDFYLQEKKGIEKVIIAGGTALLPGLKEYFEGQLKKEVIIANPFSNIFYPPILEKTLAEMGPSYAIAAGLALRGLEY